MKKIKWLYAAWPLPFSDISKKMLSNQYTDTKGQGFLLSSAGRKKIAGRYIEKSTNKSIIVDPFGNKIESFVISYYVSTFYISNSSNLLELTDPPRSLRTFISKLHALLGLGLELSDLTVDPATWLEHIENTLSPVVVTNISASGIRVPKNGLAKIGVSGRNDIRQEFYKLIGSKNKCIDTLKFLGDINDCNLSVELTKSGSARINGHIYDGFIDEVRACLESSINRE